MKTFLSAFLLLFSVQDAFAQSVSCSVLAGVYQRGSQHECFGFAEAATHQCLDLLIVTQNGCDEFAVLEKTFAVDRNRFTDHYGNNVEKMKFSNTIEVMGFRQQFGDYPIINKIDWTQVSVNLWIQSSLIQDGFQVSDYHNDYQNGYDRFARAKVTGDSNTLKIETSFHDHYGEWTPWVVKETLHKLSDRLPSAVWESTAETLNGRLNTEFKQGQWKVRPFNDSPIAIENAKSINMGELKAQLSRLDPAKKYSCDYKAHSLYQDLAHHKLILANDTLYIESIADCQEIN